MYVGTAAVMLVNRIIEYNSTFKSRNLAIGNKSQIILTLCGLHVSIIYTKKKGYIIVIFYCI